MLDRAAIVGIRHQFCTDDDLLRLFELATTGTAAAIGLHDDVLRPGAAADLVAIDATSVQEAVLGRSRRTLVMKAGRIIARDGRLVGR